MSDPTHILLPIQPTLADLHRLARTARAVVVGGRDNPGSLLIYAATLYGELVRPYAQASGVSPATFGGSAAAASDPPEPDAG